MTQEQKTELETLLDIVFEASKWKIEDGQDGIRLEVESRIRNLILTDEATVVTCEPEISPVLTGDDFNTLEAAKLNEYLDEHLASPKKVDEARKAWEKLKVRCSENGKLVWHPRAECHQVPMFPDNPLSKKFKWVWDGPKDKEVNKLSDEFWTAHEKGEE